MDSTRRDAAPRNLQQPPSEVQDRAWTFKPGQWVDFFVENRDFVPPLPPDRKVSAARIANLDVHYCNMTVSDIEYRASFVAVFFGHGVIGFLRRAIFPAMQCAAFFSAGVREASFAGSLCGRGVQLR